MFISKDLFDFNVSPIENFERLFQEVKKSKDSDPTAMTLATVDAQGRPNARIVLLKGIESGDFLFYTNYGSSKAIELNENPNACLVFYWESLYVQVRINGRVIKTTRNESENYFKTRPRLSQIGAWVSKQSEVIESYETLQVKLKNVSQQFEGKDVPCPESWGGYRVQPELFEFWFGMEGRLHYRYVYERSGDDWLRAMKSP